MKKQTASIIIWVIIALCCGYFLGYTLHFPPSKTDNISGDISKANRHKTSVESEGLRLLNEKLMADEEYRESVRFALVYLTSRIEDYQFCAQATIEACGENPEMAEVKAHMTEVLQVADHALSNATAALDGLTLITEGNGKNVDIETLSNKAYLSYSVIVKSIEGTHDDVKAINDYIKENGINGNEALLASNMMFMDACRIIAAVEGTRDIYNSFADLSEDAVKMMNTEATERQFEYRGGAQIVVKNYDKVISAIENEDFATLMANHAQRQAEELNALLASNSQTVKISETTERILTAAIQEFMMANDRGLNDKVKTINVNEKFLNGFTYAAGKELTNNIQSFLRDKSPIGQAPVDHVFTVTGRETVGDKEKLIILGSVSQEIFNTVTELGYGNIKTDNEGNIGYRL